MTKNDSPLPFTKIGDKGNTLLSNYAEIKKTSYRISAIGDIDELNSTIGLAVEHLLRDVKDKKSFLGFSSYTYKKRYEEVSRILQKIQHLIFVAGADFSTPYDINTEYRIKVKHVVYLENLIKKTHSRLTPLDSFILPNNALHLCRSVARRAERSCWAAAEKELVNEKCIIFLNRLSDLFFTLGRYISKDRKWDHNI